MEWVATSRPERTGGRGQVGANVPNGPDTWRSPIGTSVEYGVESATAAFPESLCLTGDVSKSWKPWPVFFTYETLVSKCVVMTGIMVLIALAVTTLTGDCSFPLMHSPPQVATWAAESAAVAPVLAYTHGAASACRKGTRKMNASMVVILLLELPKVWLESKWLCR